MEVNFEIIKEYIGGKREGTITNDEASMLTALIWAAKSKDPSTQVGACFINPNGRVISTGYNGAPNGWHDEDFPWGNAKEIGEENTKYPYVIHAEMNGIMNYDGPLKDFDGSTVYVTLFPCTNCSKLLIQAGVKKVVYLIDDRKDTIDNKTSKLMLKQCGIEYIDFATLTKNVSGIDISLNNTKENVKIKRRGEL